MTKEELEMRKLVRESDVIDRTDGSELAKAFNYLWEKYVEQEPCEDAISRQVVLDCLTATGLKKYDFILDARNKIKSLPSVNPQPKTGHWIRQDNTKEPLYSWYFCSECNSVIGDKTKFCSNCGCRMIDPQESEVTE